MHVLFVHQNFPAQFRFVAPRLAADHGWTCTFATRNGEAPDLPGVRRVLYEPAYGTSPGTPTELRPFGNAIGHARGVYEALKRRPDVQPDLVVAHSGFGSSLFLPYLYDCPVVFFEYFYRPVGQDMGYRPEVAVTEQMLLRSPCRNGVILLDLDNCDRGWCPNQSQRALFPPEYRGKIEAIPEGIDTRLYARRPDVKLQLADGAELPAGTRVVTYVSRGFELMRGFDVFMEAAKRIGERCPEAVFVVVGADKVYYGSEDDLVDERTFGLHVLRSGGYDTSRFCFTGHVPESTLAEILSVSDLHIYLTAPFVTSWSLLDAMSCGCVVLASDQACVREYVTHGRNGLLRDFFDAEGLADEAVRVLKEPAGHRPLGEAARRTIEENYSLDVCLPKIKAFFEDVAAKGRHGPSVLAERLIRAGTLQPRRPRGKSTGSPLPWSEVRRVEPCWVPEVVCGAAAAAPFSRSTGLQPVSALTSKLVRHGLKTRDTKKTVLFCWELGAGLGHMLPMLPLAEALVKGGHRVFVALRTLTADAAAVFGRAGVNFLQAPLRAADCRTPARTHNLTDILLNVGWRSDQELFVLGCAWRNLMRQVRPDLVLFDYSPTAMLASRGLGPDVRRVVTGLGFFCPPDLSPFPPLVEGLDEKGLRRLDGVERQVLGRANRLLRHWKAPQLDRLAQLYADADDTFLQTFAELDHYAEHRPAGTEYFGPSGVGGGKPPIWPEGDGRRVYAYLKDFPGLEELLRVLAGRGDRTIVFADNIPAAKRKRLADCTNVRFEDERLDLDAVGRECDLAVLNANHGTLCRLLLAGRPMLLVPLTLEQSVLARKVCALGAAEVCSQGVGNGEDLREKIERLATDGAYRAAAAQFARRHAFDPGELRREMLDRVTALLQGQVVPAPPQRSGRKRVATS